MKNVVGWLTQVVSWTVIIAAVALLGVSVVVPRLTGATPYVILTSSMSPAMPPGSLVVVKPAAPQEIGVGSVVTYQLRSGDPTVVTHRVKAVGLSSTGELRFTTQGDANKIPDAKLVTPQQIRGKRMYFVPFLGYVTSFVSGHQRNVLSVAVVLGLFGYAGTMLIGSVRDRRRKAAAQAAPNATAATAAAAPPAPADQQRSTDSAPEPAPLTKV